LCFRFLFFIDSFWKSIFLKLRGGAKLISIMFTCSVR
jgi:hypothetical protein